MKVRQGPYANVFYFVKESREVTLRPSKCVRASWFDRK